MKNLILLTENFPYGGGEQFLEAEIKHWENTGFDNVYIIPNSCNGEARDIPSSIKILNNSKKTKNNLLYAFISLFSSIFYKEIYYILKHYKFSGFFNNFKEALKSTLLTLRMKNSLFFSLDSVEPGDNTVYCYWNDAQFYAACILKKEGFVNKVISRAHGFDIYEERRVNHYMPLKRQFLNNFDKIYLLSKGALIYYHKTYGASFNLLEVESLGVNIPLNRPSNNEGEKIKILSLSSCVSVKQIHKIMEAVYKYATLNTQTEIEWTHIGGGPLYEKLKNKSSGYTDKQKNLSICFLGYLENVDVHNKLEINYYDIFINTSKSEGMPVSIMEAMSYGIPAIAPDIGGVSNLVNDTSGYLLPKVFSTNHIVNGINALLQADRVEFYRENSIKCIEEKFNANLNYSRFVNKVKSISGISCH